MDRSKEVRRILGELDVVGVEVTTTVKGGKLVMRRNAYDGIDGRTDFNKMSFKNMTEDMVHVLLVGWIIQGEDL